MAGTSHNQLHADIARLRKAVTRKVSRLKHRHDVEVSGTSFDPRRPPQAHREYSSKDLRAYRNELAAFVDRGNQFVGDAKRKPIPRGEWQVYKTLESQFRGIVGDYYSRISDLPLRVDKNGKVLQTIGDRMTEMQPKGRRMGGSAGNPMYEVSDKSPHSVTSRGSLKTLIESMQKKVQPGWIEEHNQKNMESFLKMMELVNEPGLVDRVKELNNEQFATLWDYSEFATAVSIPYENAQKMLASDQQAFRSDAAEQMIRYAYDLIDQAKAWNI